jgi:hypothetical protein
MWDRKEARRMLGEGKWDGYLRHAVRKLIHKLPQGLSDRFEYMLQEFRCYALEAIDDFDPENNPNVSFTTYLVKHLSIRSYQWFNWAWLAQNQPRGHGVYHISAYEDRSGSVFDTPERRCSFPQAEFNELLEVLSESSRVKLIALLHLTDEDTLESFVKVRADATAEDLLPEEYQTLALISAQKIVAKTLGISEQEAREFILEVRVLLPTYFSSVDVA